MMLGSSNLPKASYCTIVADPPWPETGAGVKGGRRGADRHYALLSVKEILAMADAVKQLRSEQGCHLYLWVTNNYLPAGLAVMDAWGFNYKTTITWAKDRMGLGQYHRGMTEHCLFGVYKALPYRMTEDMEPKRAQGRTLILSPRGEHSVKPLALLQMAELVSHPPRLELFARVRRPGWDVWGDGVATEAML